MLSAFFNSRCYLMRSWISIEVGAKVKRAVSETLAQLFYRGNYEEVLKRSTDKPDYKPTPVDITPIVGAMTFLGRLEEAEHFIERHAKKMNRENECASGFFLAIALCRQSQYDRAQTLFIRNLRLSRKSRNQTLVFYALQGTAFYRFFCGRYANAL